MGGFATRTAVGVATEKEVAAEEARTFMDYEAQPDLDS